ncbi:MAG: ATP-binding cassette domain-containing protein, partial [Actinomycetota bacterium]|nr:ATP-binding cassette domain-containing protein [Actinomycetota bacterium]
MGTVPDIQDAPDARPAPPFRGEIRFEHVDLAYDPERGIITDLNLTIPAGSKVALVGSSGAGKSTIAGLLLRLYEPQRGRITIDGHDLADLTMESVRRQIAVVLQDSVLFRGSIRDNIALGDPNASAEAIEAAARLANAHDFISALPAGYDTPVGERGSTLSGGERQRIAIARAALRDAPIVVLDEPTTGLDGPSRATVLDAIAGLTADRTVVHITHDLAAVASFDMIFHLEDGTVAENGTHGQLLHQGGSYAAAFSQQPSVPPP